MGLDLNATTVRKVGNNLEVVNDSKSILTFDNSGRFIRNSGHIMFYASNTGSSWVARSTAGWNVYPFNSLEINQGTCFNTSTNRFTAPVTGVYLFTANAYHYDSLNSYYHPLFGVNGSPAGRMPYTTAYRMRGYIQTDGYSNDAQICHIYSLIAGDYVEYFQYIPDGTVYYLGTTTHFAGYLLG
jgi:hypothetical protein